MCSAEEADVNPDISEVRLEVASAYSILPNKTENTANNSLFQPFSDIQGLEYLKNEEMSNYRYRVAFNGILIPSQW